MRYWRPKQEDPDITPQCLVITDDNCTVWCCPDFKIDWHKMPNCRNDFLIFYVEMNEKEAFIFGL